MKKTRKLLSLVLSVLVAAGSLPVFYVATTAAENISTFALDEETGTLDNPTRPVEASGVIEREDLYKMNINSQNTSYTFYQTKDDEIFAFGQTQGLQNYYETSVSDRTLTFEGITYYEGGSEMNGNTEPMEVSAGFGRWEYPLITSNPTSEFLSGYYISNTWTPTNDNAEGVSSFPFVLSGSWADIGGCKVYTWQNETLFHGHSASASGEINTGYYEQLKWNWVSSDSSANFDLRIGTTIRVLDARKLAEEIAKAEEILANADEYTDEYISSVQASLNTIPEDLRDFSKVYDQSVIDNYAQMMENISLNSADYTNFNRIYTILISITNERGAFTEESLAEFKAEIQEINQNLPKNLDKTQQGTVDAATQALLDAYDRILVYKGDVGTSDYTETKEDVAFTVDNEFFFIQVKDDQVFSYDQKWVIDRANLESKDSRRMFYSVLDTSDANTRTFASMLTSSAAQTVSSLSANAIDGTLSNQTILTCWSEIDANGNKVSGDAINADGTLNGSYNGFAKDTTYYIKSSPVFTGMSSSVTGEQTYTYVQKVFINWQQNYVVYTKNNYSNTSFTTTIKITDARHLVKAVEDANAVLADPGNHTDAYISALQAAVDAVPVELTRGAVYYTQAQVDKLYNDIISIPEDVADYSEFDEVFHSLTALNKDKYTADSYNAFIDEIYAINQGLTKNLPADQQYVIDEAIDALYAAQGKLVSSHLNSDTTFTQDDLTDLGYSPLEFSVSSTEYNFMQTVDGQTFAIRTELTARNTQSRYTCNLLSLRFSTVSAENVGTICDGRSDPDTGCHNAESVLVNQSDVVLGAVQGVTTYAVNDAGDIGEHTTWVNTSGTPLSTNGMLNDPTTLSSTESSAYAEFYYTAASGDQENIQSVNVQFAYRLGWSYYETVLGIAGETVRRHTHIPVTIRITDARALHTLYGEVEDILEGNTDKEYTFESLVNLYYAFNEIDTNMINGDVYYTQEEVNAEYEELKAAFNALEEGADYSDYFKAFVEAENIINSNNDDGYGDRLYDDDAYAEFVSKVTDIDGNLEKNLGDTPENQQKIDDATQQIIDALDEINAKKHADYVALEEAIIEAQKIVNATEGTYTDSTLADLTEALNNALALDRDLYAEHQPEIDALTSALENAIESMEFKADYSEFNEAYSQVEDIVNNPDNYTSETVQKAQDALAEADKLDKDLADLASTRKEIKDATDALKEVLEGAEEKADYSDFNAAKDALEDIVNAPDGTYTDETVQKAQEALDNANSIDPDLPKDAEGVNQGIIDEATQNMQDAINSAEEKADYSDYNNAKNEADNLVNDDGNGNPVYDEDAFNEYKEAIENIDNGLDKDLSKDDQSIVDDAAASLEDLKAALEQSKYCTVTFIDAEGNVIATERFFAGSTFGSVSAPALPEDTDAFVYVGWVYNNNALVSSEDVLSGDVTVKVAREDKVLNLNNEALSIHTATGYVTSEARDMTVEEFIVMFANDAECLEVTDLEGNVLASDDSVGTGAVITLKSKYTSAIYEVRTVVVYGDVTGDGLVNADDYSAAKTANIIPGTYTEDNYYFFVANDVMADGYIDALDTSYINLMVKGYK